MKAYEMRPVKWEQDSDTAIGYTYPDTGVGMTVFLQNGLYHGHCSFNHMRQYAQSPKGYKTIGGAKAWCIREVEKWLLKKFLRRAK